MTDSTALAQRLTVNELVAVYEQAERDIRAGFELVARAEASLTSAFSRSELCGIHVRGRFNGHTLNFVDPDDVLVEIRRQVWWSLVERLELRRCMSLAAWEELEKQLDHGEPPPVTRETVSAMANQFLQRLPEMLEEAVQEVFEWLRPRERSRGAKYKRNSQLEIGKRVIIAYAFDAGPFFGWHVSHHLDQRLTALENVLTALDGRGQRTKTHYSAIGTIIRTLKSNQPCVGETEFFKFRGHRTTRTLHLEFLRLDLLARFNQIAGGARLRPAAAAAAE